MDLAPARFGSGGVVTGKSLSVQREGKSVLAHSHLPQARPGKLPC